MRIISRHQVIWTVRTIWLAGLLLSAACLRAAAQTPSASPPQQPSSVQQLLSFSSSDVKFDLNHLMNLLRDRRHEGWVLAPYPDPKTSRPLIGAGFSLDLPARDHLQRDPLNPHPFLEPSSADLWRAARLDPQRLQTILGQYNERMAAWSKKRYQSRIRTLAPQITDDEATSLLRVSAIQAVYNAKAYCRNFDQLTGPQQMALSQLVYQMGVNLEEFTRFLTSINNLPATAAAAVETTSSLIGNADETSRQYWRSVQQSLIQSQWARLYRVRAASVIAMLDPLYPDNPIAAEQRVNATLRPAVVRRTRGRAAASRQITYSSRHSAAPHRRRSSRSHSKRRA